jgi:hypothetical protein
MNAKNIGRYCLIPPIAQNFAYPQETNVFASAFPQSWDIAIKITPRRAHFQGLSNGVDSMSSQLCVREAWRMTENYTGSDSTFQPNAELLGSLTETRDLWFVTGIC